MSVLRAVLLQMSHSSIPSDYDRVALAYPISRTEVKARATEAAMADLRKRQRQIELTSESLTMLGAKFDLDGGMSATGLEFQPFSVTEVTPMGVASDGAAYEPFKVPRLR